MVTPTRALSVEAAAALAPGDDHYRAYVGPPADYDIIGASQFNLACAAGLREGHKLLDFGCGSLRAGRLFITFLLRDRYYGLEPNTWLVEEAINRELGRDIIKIKNPTFRSENDFDIRCFNTTFDFIIAQSIFSHAGGGLVQTALQGFAKCLTPDGIALVTFIHPYQIPDAAKPEDTEWVYPGCVTYEPEDILGRIERTGLKGRALEWPHPRQRWYALAHADSRIPLL